MENSKEGNGYKQLISQLVNSNILTNQRIDNSMKQIAETNILTGQRIDDSMKQIAETNKRIDDSMKQIAETKKESLELQKQISVMQQQIGYIYQIIKKREENGENIIGFSAK